MSKICKIFILEDEYKVVKELRKELGTNFEVIYSYTPNDLIDYLRKENIEKYILLVDRKLSGDSPQDIEVNRDMLKKINDIVKDKKVITILITNYPYLQIIEEWKKDGLIHDYYNKARGLKELAEMIKKKTQQLNATDSREGKIKLRYEEFFNIMGDELADVLFVAKDPKTTEAYKNVRSWIETGIQTIVIEGNPGVGRKTLVNQIGRDLSMTVEWIKPPIPDKLDLSNKKIFAITGVSDLSTEDKESILRNLDRNPGTVCIVIATPEEKNFLRESDDFFIRFKHFKVSLPLWVNRDINEKELIIEHILRQFEKELKIKIGVTSAALDTLVHDMSFKYQNLTELKDFIKKALSQVSPFPSQNIKIITKEVLEDIYNYWEEDKNYNQDIYERFLKVFLYNLDLNKLTWDDLKKFTDDLTVKVLTEVLKKVNCQISKLKAFLNTKKHLYKDTLVRMAKDKCKSNKTNEKST